MIALLLAAALVGNGEQLQPDSSEGIHTPLLTCRAVDAKGRVVRSQSRRRAFMRATGFPNGRPGYVVDHVIPLAKGGCDLGSNMAWQRVDEGKAKDRWELDIQRWQNGTYLRLLQRAIDQEAKKR